MVDFLAQQLNIELSIKSILKDFYKENKISDGTELEQSKLNFEDSILYLYLEGLLYGFIYDPNVKVVVIDEAQDYNMMQIKTLISLFPKASFTILGDSNQSVSLVFEYNTLQELESLFTEAVYKTLSKAFRNTIEITDYCNNLLELKNVNPVRRHGRSVEEFDYSKFTKNNLVNLIEQESSSQRKTAIITKSSRTAQDLIRFFQSQDIIVSDYNKNDLKSNLIILPVYYAKGLEFDNVIVYEAKDDFFSETEQKLLYVACTRALHSLKVIRKLKSE
jgi:DNA helicase-2/ATP-dependent DNA helicase PcrA